MNAWRRVKDRLAVRRMCRIVLVSCALGLLVCTALSPGYGEGKHGMKKDMHGNGFKGGGSSGGIKSNVVWMGNKNGIQMHGMIHAGNKNGTSKMGMGNMDGIGMNVNSNGDHCGNCANCSGCGSNKIKVSTINIYASYESGHKDSKDSHDTHSSRGGHGAYDRSHGSSESDRSYKGNDSSKDHHRDRNETKIQRLDSEIITKDQGNSSTSKRKAIIAKTDDKDRNKRSSHENNEMSTVRHNENHRIISVGYNKHNDNENKEMTSAHHTGNLGRVGHNNHGERNNSYVKRDGNNDNSRSFLRGYGSRLWRFTSNNGKPSHGPSHRNSSNTYDSSKSHRDSHRKVIDETTTDAGTTTHNDSYYAPPDSFYDINRVRRYVERGYNLGHGGGSGGGGGGGGYGGFGGHGSHGGHGGHSGGGRGGLGYGALVPGGSHSFSKSSASASSVSGGVALG